ncbi:uncharacterized protein CEXT_102781 [Caerostris extrusa]|uniref:Gustatory receptor n=1 Tax=Caerostris extrusa TaxID=172846 RepID=A0AAV4QEK2_CAEEX|nr:uncharacterized protein CEXT_102781 [Caerostris extrusa]
MTESSLVESEKSLSYINNGLETDTARRKRYLLCSSTNRNQECKKLMRSDFYPVFKISAFLGISFPRLPESKETKYPHTIRKYYDIGITIITFLLCVLYTVLHGSDNRKIPQVIKTLSQLYGDISLSVYKSLRIRIYLQCILFSLLNIVLLTLTCLRVLCETKTQDLPHIVGLGYNISANGTINIVHVLVTSYIVNYCFTVFTVAVSIMCCCNVHVILRRLIQCYGDSLVQSIKDNSSKEYFAEEFSIYRRIIYGMNEADDAMSFMVLFTYVACISCFFNTLSVFIVSDDVLGKPYLAAEMVCTFIFSVVIFSTMTCSAAEVSAAGEKLKQRVLCISDIVLQRNLPSDSLTSFMIFVDGIKSADISMTGWGMFTITRGFVLSTVGVIITYGVLLFQFG